MGKYVSLADEYVNKIKPAIEESTCIDLGDMLVKEMRSSPEYKKRKDIADRDTLMFLRKGRVTQSGSREPDTIYVNEENYDKMKNASDDIPVTVSHELSHIVQEKLFEEKLRNTARPPFYKSWIDRKYQNRSFKEGFAEYMCLDHLLSYYDEKSFRKAVTDRLVRGRCKAASEDYVPYERGYKFFKDVLSVIGKDKVFELARAPPLYELEMKMPILYLLRRYPTKTITKISKALAKNIKARTTKRLAFSDKPVPF